MTIRPAKHQVIVDDGTTYLYDRKDEKQLAEVRRTQAYVLPAPSTTTAIWPGEYVTSVDRKIRIPNNTKELQVLNKNEYFCQILHAKYFYKRVVHS
jgi:hypothetical protein